jgi:hypothetical protein
MLFACFLCTLAAFTSIPARGGAIEDLENASGGKIDRGGSNGGYDSEEAQERRRRWAEYRAEQKAERERLRREESVKVNEEGHKYYRNGDWKTAVKYYKRAHKLNRSDAVIRQNLANAEAALKKQAGQEADRKEAAKIAEKKAQLEAKRKHEYEGDLDAALKRLKGDQDTLANEPAVWIEKNGKIIERRMQSSNKWSRSLAESLTTKAPPLPFKKLTELESGDVLLIAPAKTDLIGKAIKGTDALLSSAKGADASHTVLYLKQINGIRFYLDNIPGEGPRIVPEVYILNKYGKRSMEVAKLAQPLKAAEGETLYSAAREMRAKNVERLKGNKWFDSTNYGIWGKDNVVCAESDWSLLRTAGREIPKSNDLLKKGLGVDFSPADFHGDMRYFLVTPLSLTQ